MSKNLFVIVQGGYVPMYPLKFHAVDILAERDKTYSVDGTRTGRGTYKKSDPHVSTDGKAMAAKFLEMAEVQRKRLLEAIQRLDAETERVKTALSEVVPAR